MERHYGMFQSNMDGIQDAKELVKVSYLPETYDLSGQTRPMIDQGNRGICVSVALGDILTWKSKQANKPVTIHVDYFYNKRVDKKLDGMTPREAVEIATKDFGTRVYAKIQDIETLKKSIISNGPCMICLPVHSMDNQFWKGNQNFGGHAIVAVGWTKTGILIKNSWGWSYGNNGYFELPNEDFKYLYEAWTIIM